MGGDDSVTKALAVSMRQFLIQLAERKLGKPIAALLLALLAGLFPLLQNTETARVIHVIDGDTLDIAIGKTHAHVRLVGIDTPERMPNDKAERDANALRLSVREITAQGERARAYLQTLAPPNTTVRLEYDVEQRDRYGRTLAYVFLENGEMINERMVRDGFAAPFTFPPNVRYVDRFRAAYEAARQEKVGLWKETSRGPGSGDQGRHNNARQR